MPIFNMDKSSTGLAAYNQLKIHFNCIVQWNLYMILFSLLLNTYIGTENYKWKQGLWGSV